ncbi:hypothetical protein AQ616_18745 [Oceanobacillus sp. E9]|uniref:hypothetical protein n=1 Tax=Oceanobacillus sp. E9 TaxID=1742575 RepID=UPI00084ECB70|nr:hypothetical protein [Oceanobacillus sp. E9]OEH52944.1 hypothetical protein AQ616_18745 [Oceanobacillus sp. E9]
MEKVKVTKEQAGEIKDHVSRNSEDLVFKLHLSNPNGWTGTSKVLNGMDITTMAKALYIGYEIEPEFKVGDWVVVTFDLHNSYGQIKQITKVEKSCAVGRDVYFELDGGGCYYPNEIKHATTEEIKQEKERRWWAKHGREVWELKMGDTLINKNDRYSCDVKFVEGSDPTGTLLVNGRKDEFIELIEDLKKEYIVFCFKKDRLDLSN